MKPLASALLLSMLALAPATAQVAAPGAEPAGTTAPASPSVEEFARKVNIVTRAKAVTAIPENEPLAVDLGLVDVPGIPARLTQDVTAKGYARHVVVDGELIGQLVMTGVEKKGRVEPLNSKDFVAQFNLDRPELDPETPVTVEGDEEELKAALERLAADEEETGADKEAETAGDGRDGVGGRSGTNATQNPDAAGYRTPEALDIAREDKAATIRITTEGCEIRVDLDQMEAIQQNRVETTEDGVVTPGTCEDGDQRYPIKRSYAACGDGIDIEARTATAQYLLFYTDGGGTRHEISDCQADPEQVFRIVEDRDACTIQIDYEQKQAISRAALIYVNANNNEVQVRGCEPSEEVAAVPLIPVTDGCSIRHDFAAGQSFQQGRHIYELDGITWQAGSCTDNGTEYAHQKVYDTATGTPVCPPLVDEDSGTVTLQSKVAITVDGVQQFITDCRPDTNTQTLVATTEGCDNPATWTHDVTTGVSYGRERFYYTHAGARRYVTECRDSATSYPHQVETVGWQNHDDQLFAYRVETVFITTPSGRYDVETAVVRPGAPQEPYVYEGERKVGNGERWYEDCSRMQGQNRVETYRRPDNSLFDLVAGEAEPLIEGNACTVDRPDTSADWPRTAEAYRDRGAYIGVGEWWQEASATCSYTATRRVVRVDGTLISSETATKSYVFATWGGQSHWSTLNYYDKTFTTFSEFKNTEGYSYGHPWWCRTYGCAESSHRCPATAPGNQVSQFLGELGW